MTTTPSGKRLLPAVAVALILMPLLWRTWLLQTRTFDPDEMQHLHVAWLVSQGDVPYRDFFEHHMPGLALVMAPLLPAFDTTRSFDAVIQAMLASRAVMLLCAALTVAATWKLGDLAFGRETAWIAAAWLSLSMVFVGRTLEIRPDVPASACWTASLVAVGLATRPRHAHRGGTFWFASGLLLGAALVFTQKLLLAGPGLAVASIVHVAAGRSASEMAAAARRVVTMVAGFVAPLGAVAALFAARSAFWPLVDSTLLVNLGWHVEVTPLKTLRWLALRDPWLCAFGLGGLLLGTMVAWRGRRLKPLRLFLTCGAVSLVAGLFAIPTPFPQYTLLFLPLVSVLGAGLLWRSLQWLAARAHLPRHRTPIARPLLVGASWATTAAVSLAIAAPFFRHPLSYPALAVLVVSTVALLVRRRLLHAAAAAVLAGTAVYQAQQAIWMSGLSNAGQVEAMRVVHAAAGPTDTVLDGFSGYGWFRPHAWFYFFVHPGVRLGVPGAAIEDLRGLLADGSTRPRIVIADHHLLALIPDALKLLPSHYDRFDVEGAVIWVRSDRTP